MARRSTTDTLVTIGAIGAIGQFGYNLVAAKGNVGDAWALMQAQLSKFFKGAAKAAGDAADNAGGGNRGSGGGRQFAHNPVDLGALGAPGWAWDQVTNQVYALDGASGVIGGVSTWHHAVQAAQAWHRNKG